LECKRLACRRLCEPAACTVLDQQNKTEGSWVGSGGYGVGPVSITSVNLAILQLDKGVLPIFQR
jgi:hypothetical protein